MGPTPTQEIEPTPTEEMGPTPTQEMEPTPTEEMVPTESPDFILETPCATHAPPVKQTPVKRPPVKLRCTLESVDATNHTAKRCCENRYPCHSAQCAGSKACENPDMCYCRVSSCKLVYIHYSMNKHLTHDCATQMI